MATQRHEYLFVYGTLRKESKSQTSLSLGLERYIDFIGDATFKGKLFRIRDYAGAVYSKEPNDVVFGEVYSLRNPKLVLEKLDEYEDCGPDCPTPTEYIRKKTAVRLMNGKTIDAWVYLYNHPTDGMTLISSGNYLKFHDHLKE